MVNEKTSTDQLVRRFIEDLGISYEEQASSNVQIKAALKNASKSKDSKGIGKPEFIFFSGSHLFIIEDKLAVDKIEYKDENGNIDTEFPYRRDYAVNGAVHYAKHIIEKTNSYKEVIAIGIAGDGVHYQIHPYFVSETEVKALPEMKSLEDISPENVEEFYNVAIKGELPKEERELREVNKVAADMHEDLRNYGQLEGEKKATVVSAILLALEEPTFSLDQLQGSDREGSADGELLFTAVQRFLQNAGIVPYAKVGEMLDQFTFIQRDVTLNTINSNLEMTPLKYFATKLEAEIMDKIKSNTDFDILGNFYGEFVKYGGSDGNSLGIVLTPRHITSLMAELIQINKSDYVLDPACGTGAFLISAMNRMLAQAENDEERTDIKQNRLYGIEIQQKLFTIATTNMILRGDGKSNLIRDNSLTFDSEEMKNKGINKILMNPPYSQAKNNQTQHLSELSFIFKALEMLVVGGKLCVIVPQSTMVGKNRHDKARKKQILEKHTLESVITLNTDTFHGVGVNPCLALFTAGIAHPENKRVSFINFEDDGYKVRKHIGLVGDGSEKGKREHLINVLEGNEDDGTAFIVKTTIKDTDEWLHSFYFFNDQIPSENDFSKAFADYLAFKIYMLATGNDYLFKDDRGVFKANNIEDHRTLDEVSWKQYKMNEVFSINSGVRLTKADMKPGKIPFIGATDRNNGITEFTSNTNNSLDSNVLGVNYNGSVVENFYHPYEAVFSDDVKRLKLKNHDNNKYILLFMKTIILQQKVKYAYGYKFNATRMKEQIILLPSKDDEKPDYEFMEQYMKRQENKIIELINDRTHK